MIHGSKYRDYFSSESILSGLVDLFLFWKASFLAKTVLQSNKNYFNSILVLRRRLEHYLWPFYGISGQKSQVLINWKPYFSSKSQV